MKQCFHIKRLVFLASLLLVIILGQPLILCGQKINQEHFSIEQGLSNRLVESLLMDSTGLIWVATSNGLNRFDGYEFVNFLTDEKSPSGTQLSHSHISEIKMSRSGLLVILYRDLYTSFDLLNLKTFEVTKVEVALGMQGQPRKIYVDKAGEIFALSKGKQHTTVFQLDAVTLKFYELFSISDFWLGQYPDVHLLHLIDGSFMIQDEEHGLRQFSETGEHLQTFDLAKIAGDSVAWHSTACILEQSKDGKIWVSYKLNQGLFVKEPDQPNFGYAQGVKKDVFFTNLWEDEKGNVLINEARILGNYPASSHLWLYGIDGKISDYSRLLKYGVYIQAALGDDFSQGLITGKDTGLQIFQHSFSSVSLYLNEDIKEDRRGASMRGITGDGNGKVYFAREVKRWYALDLATNVLDTIRLHDEDTGEIIDFNCGLGFFYDAKGFLWGVSCDGTVEQAGNIIRYDLEECNTRIYSKRNSFTAVIELDDNRLLLAEERDGGRGELVIFDTQKEVFYPFDSLLNNGIQFPLIRYILQTNDQHYWLGTENGLFELDENRKLINQYFHNTHPKNLSDNTIFALYEDEQSNLWIGTKNGLTLFDPNRERSLTYNTEDGLASSVVAAILPGSNGGLWISTYNGLSYFNPDKERSRRFYRVDGFSHNEFNRYSSYKDENGRYYFGGVNGVNAFYEEDLLAEREIPKVIFTGFVRYDGKLDSLVVQSNYLLDNQEIVVEPYYSYINLNFTLPIYKPIVKNRFRYQIGSALTDDWIYLKEDRSLSFNNIKSGKYKIFVQGADANGNWSTETLVINMLVKEVFYKTWWFFVLVGLLLLFFAYGLLRFRWSQKLRVERLRTQLASDLHDEVSGLLAGISLQTELLSDQAKEEDLRAKLQRIRLASQQAMIKMSDVIWSIDSRRDRFKDLVYRMEEHADDVLLPINIKYKLEVDLIDQEQLMPANIRQELYFIYKEAINNVAKHSNANLVHVKMANYNNYFHLSIKDNGKSAESKDKKTPNGKRKGQGLSNLKMRSERLKAELQIIKGKGYFIDLKMKKFI